MRKQLASLWACLIYRAQIAVEEHTSVLRSLQDAAFLRCFDRIIPNELIEFQTEKTAEVIDVAIGDLCCGNTATISARGAVDLVFDLLRDGLEAAFDEVVPPEPRTETPVFFAVFLPVALYLYEVC